MQFMPGLLRRTSSLSLYATRSSRLRKNYVGGLEIRWFAGVAQQEHTTQDNRSRHARLAEKARRAKVRGPKFEVFETSNPELRTSDHACCAWRARRALEMLADFFSILLEVSRWMREICDGTEKISSRGLTRLRMSPATGMVLRQLVDRRVSPYRLSPG